MLNSRDIGLLRADVAENCLAWLERCEKAGLKVLVTGTVRDREYQEYCYRNGTSKTATPTFHAQGIGLAFDFCQNIKGREYSDLTFFSRAAALAKEMGFTWGGDWKSFPDRPHLQWDEHGKYTGSMLLTGKRPGKMPLWKEESELTEKEITAIVDAAVSAAVSAAKPKVYTTMEEVPIWAQGLVERALGAEILNGDQYGRLHLTDDNLVNLQMLSNAGLF